MNNRELSALQIYIEQQQYVQDGLITHEEALRQYEQRKAEQWQTAQQISPCDMLRCPAF